MVIRMVGEGVFNDVTGVNFLAAFILNVKIVKVYRSFNVLVIVCRDEKPHNIFHLDLVEEFSDVII